MRLESPMAVLISDKLTGHTIPKSIHVPVHSERDYYITDAHVVHTIERASGCHVAWVNYQLRLFTGRGEGWCVFHRYRYN